MPSFIANNFKKICMILALCFPLQLCAADDDEKIESLKQEILDYIKAIDQIQDEVQQDKEVTKFYYFVYDNKKNPFFNVEISKNYPVSIETLNEFSTETLKKVFVKLDYYLSDTNKFLFFKFLYDPNTELELLKKIIDKMTDGFSHKFVSIEEGLEFFENIRRIYLKHNELYVDCLRFLNKLLYYTDESLRVQVFSKIEKSLIEDTKIMTQSSETFYQLKKTFLKCSQTLTESMCAYFTDQKELFMDSSKYKDCDLAKYGEKFEELKFALYREILLDEHSSFLAFQELIHYFLSALPYFSHEKQSIIFNTAYQVFNESPDVMRQILILDILMDFNLSQNVITQIKNKTQPISQLLLNDDTYSKETKVVYIKTIAEIIKKYGLPNELDIFFENISKNTCPSIRMYGLYKMLFRTKINDIEKLQKLLNEVLLTDMIDSNGCFIKDKINFLYTYLPYASIHEKTKIINASHELLIKAKKNKKYILDKTKVEYGTKDEWSCEGQQYYLDIFTLDPSFELNPYFPSFIEFSNPWSRSIFKNISFDFSKMTNTERTEFLEIFAGLASIDDVDSNFMGSVIVLMWDYLKDFYKDNLDLKTNEVFRFDIENYLCLLIHAILKNADFLSEHPRYLNKLIDLYTHFEFDHSNMSVEAMLNDLQKIRSAQTYHFEYELNLLLKIVKIIENKETYKNLIFQTAEELCKDRIIHELHFFRLFELTEYFHQVGFKKEVTFFLNNIWAQINLEELKDRINSKCLDLNSFSFVCEFLKEKGIEFDEMEE